MARSVVPMADWVAESRRRQGLAAGVTDPAGIDRLRRILARATDTKAAA